MKEKNALVFIDTRFYFYYYVGKKRTEGEHTSPHSFRQFIFCNFNDTDVDTSDHFVVYVCSSDDPREFKNFCNSFLHIDDDNHVVMFQTLTMENNIVDQYKGCHIHYGHSSFDEHE